MCLATDTWQVYLKLLSKVLDIVIQSGLKLKTKKCLFGAEEVTFLELMVTSTGLKQDPAKLQAWTELPPPNDASGVRRILGALGYYRKFIPKFSILADPLIRLTRKYDKFI